ncbi:NAD(P)-dependent oxidoreductase [Streptomyces sp. NBC_01433]|uniref:NAD-dependent epimerase/dehydratase family protein n=1 Tax=Streptomyces sp. NBC_01433 TaxID=2903864 RepID=UPI00224E2044|nr:NAD(P)-dependent oxidoreductase [Streptomyces sp. NBC_01433]MCX4678966.1 NAD(P)-dependent oxidoreductase [Streptomyces sp. NBC_01433]
MAGTVVVFGAKGFIGRCVTAALAADGWRCTGVDRYGRTTGGAGEVDGPYYAGNDWSSLALSRFLRRCGPAVIVNAVGASWSTDPAVVRRDNVVWPCRLAEACERSGTTESILHLGSSHEYGDTAPGVRVSESSVLAPLTTYGKSKTAGASHLVRAAYRMNRPVTLIRAFNVIGPGHGTKGIWASAVGLYRAAEEAGSEQVVANVPLPETARDLIDVRDVAGLVSLAAGRPGPAVAVYNAASGTATSIRQLFDAFAAQTGIPYRFGRNPGGLRTGARWQCADTARAESHLGWTRDFTLTDSIGAALARSETASAALG